MDRPEAHQEATSIDLLNDDCLSRIFDYLNFDDKIRLRRTSQRWRRLLERQVERTKALRLGEFLQGGYTVTSGLLMAPCQHSRLPYHRQHTGTLFNDQLMPSPPDLETQCYSIQRYDHLHRALKHCAPSITMLSLGRLNISYRLLMVLANNLPNLEHLELIGCASGLEPRDKRLLSEAPPSLESFNSNSRLRQAALYEHSAPPTMNSHLLFNQHLDEQVNMEQRLVRAQLVRECQLVREARQRQQWPRLQHLLVKDCNLLNEFSLSLLVAITSQSLTQLQVESSQYLTGEFLNYCGPHLKILKLKHCPLLQVRFLEDLVKIKQLLQPPPPPVDIANNSTTNKQTTTTMTTAPTQLTVPIITPMISRSSNFGQAIDCFL